MSFYPTITVLIVNLNGREFIGECLDSLANQNYPTDRITTIVVDNGSTDNSVRYLRQKYPYVQVVSAGHNLGFAGGNNAGARIATGDYLALLNNDAHAGPNWLLNLVEALHDQKERVCAAGKILSQDGQYIDFVGSALNLYGRAFQIDEGIPNTPEIYNTPRELLAPCGGAMMIRRDVFLDIGGFDEDYIAYYEDVDLGWRLWLYGYKVIFVPDAITYHRNHQTGSRFPVEQRYTLSELNAWRTIIKNYEESNLQQVFPLSLILSIKRAANQGKMDRHRYEFGAPTSGNPTVGLYEVEPAMTYVATSFLTAIDLMADELPHLLAKRRQIQARRVRTDEDIFKQFPMRTDNPLFPWRQYQVAHDALASVFNIQNSVAPKRGCRLLIVTHENISSKMAGPGIRAWEMACALSEQFYVTLAVPGTPGRSYPNVNIVEYTTEDPSYTSLNSHINNADVILAMGPLLRKLPPLKDSSKPLIVDLYDPFEVENLSRSLSIEPQYHREIDIQNSLGLSTLSSVGDFYICASERQRDFWLGTLLANGRLNTQNYASDPTLRLLIDIVPFGIPSEPPVKHARVLKGVHSGIAESDKILLWNGGLWDWFDPLTLIEAMPEILKTRDDVKLYFASGKHFDSNTVPEMPVYAKVVSRCTELGLLDRYVFFGNWIPYDERADYLLEADIGISIHPATLESHLASRTRLMDCLWAGLPIISTEGDPISDMIATNALGRTVPPGRPDLIAQAVIEMLADNDLRSRISGLLQPLRSKYSWAEVVRPIEDFMQRATFAPDALQATRQIISKDQQIVDLQGQVNILRQQVESLSTKSETLEQEKLNALHYAEQLSEHLTAIRQGRLMRVMRSVNVLLGRE
jgi:GT2 family glycosyltransferase/glycosyltransferase involved in cell wall biosynthesis